MFIRFIKFAIIQIVGGAYWQIIAVAFQVKEPWDSINYWTIFYPLSLVISAVLGGFLRRDGWVAGALITFSQLPVIMLNSGVGPLLPIGLVFLIFLAMPALAVSALTGRYSTKARRD